MTPRISAMTGALLALLVGTTNGCGSGDSCCDGPADHSLYVTHGAAFVWDDGRDAFVRLDLSEPPGSPHPLAVYDLGERSVDRVVRSSPAGESLILLAPSARTLTVQPADGATASDYDLGQPFNALTISDDGRHAIAYMTDGDHALDVARADNLLAFLDLTTAPSDTNPVTRAVSSYGGARLGVDVSPEFLVGGEAHRLAVIRSQGHVALVDLEHPDGDAIAVPLVIPGDDVSLAPRAARFAVRESERGGLWVFLTAAGSGDVIALDVTGDDGADTHGALRASLNQHAVGSWVDDALPVTASDGTLYVAAISAASRVFALIEVATGATRTFQLATAFDEMTPFAVADDDGVTRPYILLTAVGARTFGVVAIDDVQTRGTKALRSRSLRETYDTIEPVPGQPRFIAFDAEQSSMTVAWLTREAAEDSVSFGGRAIAHLFSENGERLFVLVNGSSRDQLVTVDITTGAVQSLTLDARALSMDMLPDSGRLLIAHTSEVGHLTYIDPEQLERSQSERILGFLLDGWLAQ